LRAKDKGFHPVLVIAPTYTEFFLIKKITEIIDRLLILILIHVILLDSDFTCWFFNSFYDCDLKKIYKL